MPRKRTHDEMAASVPEPAAEPQNSSLLSKIRSMWEFAAVMQFIFMFGKAVKIDDDFDIEDFEDECLKVQPSYKLEEIGLQMLKWISSFRALDYDNWDEYVRRQYQSKAPTAHHPYGDDETPLRFRDFDVFTKIRVLHKLSVWTLWNPDKMRALFPDYPKELDQTQWRIEPVGWDDDEREYYVLDDNRLYRRTEPALPKAAPAKLKYTSKKAVAQRRKERASKRRRTMVEDDDDTEMNDGDDEGEAVKDEDATPDDRDTTEQDTDPSTLDTNGGYKWECIAITFEDYQSFLDSIKKTKDTNQKNLYKYITDNIMPEIAKAAERQQRKIEARQRELATLEKMATAKRSSRIADKQERERAEFEAAEHERKRAAALAAARKDEERQAQMTQDRHSRMMTREQRIKDREFKRILMEDQIARDSEEEKKIEEGSARGSARHIKEKLARSRKQLEALEDDDDWTFDCSGCGKFGKNFDDGEHSIACERCNVWQHSKCLNFSQTDAEDAAFHFVCADCKRREEEANRPKISLKFKVGQSSSPPQPQPTTSSPETKKASISPSAHRFVNVGIPITNGQQRPSVQGSFINGQFYPEASRPPVPPTAPSHHPATQPSLPGYARKNYDLQAAQTNPHAQPRLQQNGVAGHQIPHSQNQLLGYPQQHFTPHGGNFNPSIQRQETPQHQHVGPHLTSSHSRTDSQRLPSPVTNRPTLSPTQGNHDVSPIAGVPHGPIPHQSAQPRPVPAPVYNNYPLSNANGAGAGPHMNGTSSSQSPGRTPQQPSTRIPSSPPYMMPVSGLSPTKQRSSPPQAPAHLPQQSRETPQSTPQSSFNSDHQRTVSGTPIFPPAQRLAPSPQQMNRKPVPTPSKQDQPPVRSSPPPSVSRLEGQPSAQPSSFGPDIAHAAAAQVAQKIGMERGIDVMKPVEKSSTVGAGPAPIEPPADNPFS